MHERERFGARREFDRPIEGGIAAAEHQQALAVVLFGLADAVEDLAVDEGVDAVHAQRHGLEGADPARDHHGAGVEGLAGAGGDVKTPAFAGFHFGDLALQMKDRRERLDLLQQPIHQLLGVAHRNGRNVVDGLVRVELRALAAGRGHGVHDVRLDAEQAEFEDLEQAARAAADNDDIRVYGGQRILLESRSRGSQAAVDAQSM